jgi:hypothetical protein
MCADKVIHLKWEKSGCSESSAFQDCLHLLIQPAHLLQTAMRSSALTGQHSAATLVVIAALRKAARARSLWLAQCRLLRATWQRLIECLTSTVLRCQWVPLVQTQGRLAHDSAYADSTCSIQSHSQLLTPQAGQSDYLCSACRWMFQGGTPRVKRISKCARSLLQDEFQILPAEPPCEDITTDKVDSCRGRAKALSRDCKAQQTHSRHRADL